MASHREEMVLRLAAELRAAEAHLRVSATTVLAIGLPSSVEGYRVLVKYAERVAELAAGIEAGLAQGKAVRHA